MGFVISNIVVEVLPNPMDSNGKTGCQFALNDLDPPHNHLAVVPVGNRVILLAERVRLSRDTQETWAELREPRAHRLIKAVEPRGVIRIGVMTIESINHITFVEPIDEAIGFHCWHLGKPHCRVNLEEVTQDSRS
jgi:hypothetical protein